MNTGEHPIAEAAQPIREQTVVQIELKLFVALICFMVGLASGGALLASKVADAEPRISRLEDEWATQTVLNKGFQDCLDHIQKTTDQTAQDVKELQRGAR